ncbi:hypothetical protein ACFL96_05130 [Thermoproteota archaeon]
MSVEKIAKLLEHKVSGLTKRQMIEQSGLSKSTVERHLSALRKKGLLVSEKDQESKALTYSLYHPSDVISKKQARSLEGIIARETVDNPTRHTYSGKVKDGEKTTLYLGEMALGTKASDPRAMRGLAYFIEANDLDKNIGHVLMNGGLLPYIPSYYGIQNAREMIFLGNDWDKEVNDRAKLVLRSDTDQEAKEFIKKWVAYKITNTAQAIENSRKVITPLTEVLNDSQWHYMLGEEDNKNTDALIEVKLNDYKRVEKNRQKMGQQIEEWTSGIEEAKHELEAAKHDYQEFTSSGEDAANIKKLEQKIKKTEIKIRDTRRKVRDYELALNAIEREKEASAFFKITKRQYVQADEAELLRWMAKNEYNANLYHIFEDMPNFRVHSGNEVDLIIDDVNVTLAHKASIVSNVAGSSELRKIAQRNRGDNRRGMDVPDIYVVAHGAEGFRHQPMAKRTETIVDGETRNTPEFCMNMQLPTLQSEKQLEVLRKKGVKNEHTKRWEKGNFSSGAVFYTVKESGEHEVSMISTNELITMCGIGDKIEKQKKKLEKTKQKQKKEKIESNIAILEERLKINSSYGMTVSDTHLGCPNKPGRPSNFDFLDAAIRYVKEEGMPDVLMLNGDIVHGIHDRAFGSNEQYLSETPKRIQELMEQIKDDETLSPLEKLAAMDELAHTALQGIPITHMSKQWREVKRRLIPFVQEVLDNDGYVIVTSGNHYNKSTKTRMDEATDFVNILDLKYLDSPRLKEFVGLGEGQGMGEAVLPNGWKVYAAHCPKRGTDSVAGAMKQMLGANKDAKLTVFGDVHHGGGGYSDGSFVLVCAAMQPWVPYVDYIGMQPSLRGIINFEYDQKGKEWFKWKYVLDQTLERDEYMK